MELIDETDAVFHRIIADVDAARSTCHMVFYIWNNGGLADEVAEALIRAAKRGVICRVLVDDVGSAPFLRSETARRLREEGIRLHLGASGRVDSFSVRSPRFADAPEDRCD